MEYLELAFIAVTLESVAVGENQDGEVILIYPILNAGDVIRVDTFQDNGWTRVNYYHEDGTVEELYKRDELL